MLPLLLGKECLVALQKAICARREYWSESRFVPLSDSVPSVHKLQTQDLLEGDTAPEEY